MSDDGDITITEVRKELNDFHDFVDRAVSKRLSEEEKAELRTHLTEDFELVKEKELVWLDETVEDLDEAKGIPPDVEFEAKDPEILQRGDGFAYVRYVYSIEGAGKIVHKYATVLLVRDDDAPNGVAIAAIHNPGGF